MPTSGKAPRSRSSDPPEVVLRRRNNTPPGANSTNNTVNRIPRLSSFNRRDSLRNHIAALTYLHQHATCGVQRPMSLNYESFDGFRSPRYQSGYQSPVAEMQIEPKPKRSLFKNVFEAEVSLWALSMSIFFAVSSKFRRNFILFNLCVVAPIFVTVTTVLSGWVVLFAVIGHYYYSVEELKDDGLRYHSSPSNIQSPLSSRSSIGSHEDIEEKDDRPIEMNINSNLINQNPVNVPHIYSRVTSVQRQYINGHQRFEILARS